MKLLFEILLIIFIITLACASVWKTAEIRAIHKIREAFSSRKLLLKRVEDGYSEDFFKGFEEAEEMLNGIEDKVKEEKVL